MRSLAFRPRCQHLPAGYRLGMKNERDELDSLAAEAGQSAVLVGMNGAHPRGGAGPRLRRLTSNRRQGRAGIAELA